MDKKINKRKRVKGVYKIIYIMVFLIVMLSTYSTASDLIYKQRSEVSLKVSCFDENNSLCEDTTVCNITVSKPNSDLLIYNQIMTNQNNIFNYSLDNNETTDIGTYQVLVTCEGDDDGFTTFDYEITPTGTKPNTAQGIIYMVMFFVGIVLLTITLVAFFRIDIKR
jgi:hypothetical protein